MNKNTERIERYLKGIDVPGCDDAPHRQQLRQQIVGEAGRRRIHSERTRIWKYAAVIALIGTGVVAGAAVGVKFQKYHFVAQDPERGYIVQSEDSRSVMTLQTDSPEEAVKYAEELALLKQQNRRELVSIVETAVNGQPDSRLLLYQYGLSNGKTRFVGEQDPNSSGRFTLAGDRLQEALHTLGKQGLTISYNQSVQGRPFSFQTRKAVLSDGTEVVQTQGLPRQRSKLVNHNGEVLWTLELSLEMPELAPPALQWAVFDEDPLALFGERVGRRSAIYAATVNAAPDARKELVRQAQISVAWDVAFRKITADELYLLAPAPRGTYSYATNSPAGKKWIVTKTVTIDKKPCCWCVPVESGGEEEISIVFDKTNIIDLTQIYDSIVNPQSEK